MSPDEFINIAMKSGVEGIAITDHNTGAWIDRIKEAAKGRLAVFPGVEITTTGGKNGSIHILAIFGIDATTKTIENLLGALGIRAEDYGSPEAVTPMSPEQVISVIAEHGGLPILAHADSNKGVLHDMSGVPRTRVMNHPQLIAVEVHDYSKYFRMLDGTDKNYKRELAVYRASDNRSQTRSDCHSADAIGSRYTYFKMDGISLESLRQCFCDREVRISPDVEAEEEEDLAFPRILQVEVQDGFLAGQGAVFHDGLNSIIGGQGVGKSLLVEFIRFALCQSSQIKSVEKDYIGKLSAKLGIGGSVVVHVQLSTGQLLRVMRTFDGNDNPVRVVEVDTGEVIEADVAEIFPILGYSQTEVIEIARDGAAQLALIDTFLDAADLEHQRLSLIGRLRESDRKLAHAIQASSGIAEQQGELNTVDAQLKHVTEALQSPKFGEIDGLTPKTEYIGVLKDVAKALSANYLKAREVVEHLQLPDVPEKFTADTELKHVFVEAQQL